MTEIERLTSQMTPDAARALTEEARADGERLYEKVLRLHNGGAHLALGYTSWHAYAAAELRLGKSRAYQLLDHARITQEIDSTIVERPNEAQARELARVPEPEREQVWRETLARTDGKPTAAAVREVAEPVEQQSEQITVEREPGGLAEVVRSAPQPVRRDPTPEEIEADRQRRYTSSLGDVLVSAWALLDPDPGTAVKRSWRREHSVHVGLPLQANRFTAGGIRHTAGLLAALADHVEQNGGAL